MMNNVTFWNFSMVNHPYPLRSQFPLVRLAYFYESPWPVISISYSDLDRSNRALCQRYFIFLKLRGYREVNSFKVFIPWIIAFLENGIFFGTFRGTEISLRCQKNFFLIKNLSTAIASYFFTKLSAIPRAAISSAFNKIRSYGKFLSASFTKRLHINKCISTYNKNKDKSGTTLIRGK